MLRSPIRWGCGHFYPIHPPTQLVGVIIRRAAVQPCESFQATGKQKTRRFVAALLGCGQKNSGDGFLQSIWQTWNFMICCFFVGVMFALLKLSGLKVYRSLHHKIFSVLFCWSLSDPKFHGMSFCQGKWSTVFFQWEFVSKKHEMPNYTTSHIHTFFCSGTNYGDLGMCSSTFCHELLRWPSLGTERNTSFSVRYDWTLKSYTQKNTVHLRRHSPACLFWGFESHPRFSR